MRSIPQHVVGSRSRDHKGPFSCYEVTGGYEHFRKFAACRKGQKGIRPDVLGCHGASVPAMLDHDLMRSSETCSRLSDARLVAFTGWHLELLAGSNL